MKSAVSQIYSYLRSCGGNSLACSNAIVAITAASMVFDLVPFPDVEDDNSVIKWYEEIKLRLQKNYIGRNISSKQSKLVIEYLILNRQNERKSASALLTKIRDLV